MYKNKTTVSVDGHSIKRFKTNTKT